MLFQYGLARSSIILGRQTALRIATRSFSDTCVRANQSKRAAAMFPSFMKSYANKFKNAPVSHITAFLIVHELTAIVPLFAVWGGLYYFDVGCTFGIPDWAIEQGTGFIKRMAERNEWQYLAHAEQSSKLLLQGAVAWAAVKVTLPLRLAFSVYVAPWTAQHLLRPIGQAIRGIVRLVTRR